MVDAVWAAVEPLLPPSPIDEHPLGCHRPRVPDRVCFQGILVRLLTGSAWVDGEALMGNRVSDTTLRDRRDQCVRPGVFDRLADEAVAGYEPRRGTRSQRVLRRRQPAQGSARR